MQTTAAIKRCPCCMKELAASGTWKSNAEPVRYAYPALFCETCNLTYYYKQEDPIDSGEIDWDDEAT